MLGFIRAFEATAMSAGIAAMNSGDGGVTRVIRHVPNRQAMRQIVEAARGHKARADAAEAEIVKLRRSLTLTRRALRQATENCGSGSAQP